MRQINEHVELLGQATDDGVIGGWGIGYSDANGCNLHGWFVGDTKDFIGDNVEQIMADMVEALTPDEDD